MFKKLPSVVTIYKEDVEQYVLDDLENELADILSDQYGFCIFSLNYKEVGDKIIVSDIKWDETE